MSSVVLLGAGFSRAISSAMPLMIDLGRALSDRLELPDEALDPFGGDVESWLAYLASDEPWLGEAEILHNRATFVRAVGALNDVIREAETVASAEPSPVWLRRAAWQWSHDRAQILTFNYDTLLESAIRAVGWAGTLSDLYAVSLSERFPAGSSRFLSANSPRHELPTVYKMHGSVNWLHGGERSPVTEQLVLREERKGVADAPRYARLYDDLEPFVVPPTSSKNRYYDRSALRTQWRQAGEQLATAETLDIIGYSFPASDLGTRAFLSTRLAKSATLTLSDPSPAVTDRLHSALPANHLVSTFAAVGEYVDAFCGDIVRVWYENSEYRQGAFIDINDETQQLSGDFDLGNQPIDALVKLAKSRFPRIAYGESRSWTQNNYSLQGWGGFQPSTR